jgi:putative endonuclease
MQHYYAYFARCKDNTLYAGYTTDLKKREKAHNEGKGAHYTRMRRPVKIVYNEQFETRSEAQKREYQLKQLSKKDKESLVGT